MQLTSTHLENVVYELCLGCWCTWRDGQWGEPVRTTEKLGDLGGTKGGTGVFRVGLRGVSKSCKSKWLVKVGATKGVTPLI